MSKQLLLDLNGNKTGQLKDFLDNFKCEPGIAWLLNVLKKLGCEVFITDDFALKLCPSIPGGSVAELTPIRVVEGEGWLNHGDVTWNLVT